MRGGAPHPLVCLAATVLVALSAAGCTSSSTPGVTSGDRDVISLVEIDAGRMRHASAYELVRALKPHWLSDLRGDVRVFQNGQEYGGPEALRDFTLDSIREVRYVGLKDSYRYTQSDRPTVVVLVSSR